MINLKVTINGIIEGLQSYENLSLEGPSKVIESIDLAIQGAKGALEEVRANRKRGAVYKYFYGTADRKIILDAIEVLDLALESLMVKIRLANQGAIRAGNITDEQINKHAMIYLRHSENAVQFWRDFVREKSWSINTQKASFYLKQYIVAYNSQVASHLHIRQDNLQLVLAKLLDKNNDGSVQPEEIGSFFYDIWDDENARMKINTISKEDPIDQENARSYLLVQQCCKELQLDYYFEIMKRKGINTRMFLSSTYEALKDALKEIEPEHVSMLYLKAQAHNDRKAFYYDI